MIKLHFYALPPLTTEDQVPPEGLLRAGGVVEASPDAQCAINSTPGGPAPRQEGTLCALGVLWDFGDILGGPTKQSIITPHYSIPQYKTRITHCIIHTHRVYLTASHLHAKYTSLHYTCTQYTSLQHSVHLTASHLHAKYTSLHYSVYLTVSYLHTEYTSLHHSICLTA